MTPFCSVALYRRNNETVFKPPRKEHPDTLTQARKSAVRYWRGRATEDDTLIKVVLLREIDGRIEISERTNAGRSDAPWVQFSTDPASAAREAHLAACMGELGIDPEDTPPVMPDVLTINGFVYRREI